MDAMTQFLRSSSFLPPPPSGVLFEENKVRQRQRYLYLRNVELGRSEDMLLMSEIPRTLRIYLRLPRNALRNAWYIFSHLELSIYNYKLQTIIYC